ncbi:MAG: hypothetical protein H7Y88_03100 [Phycisphaerales bacterium]|nr:hypothetical protein [Phycisphaerales bacterium]
MSTSKAKGAGDTLATAELTTTARARRARFGLRTAVVMLAVTAVCLFAGLIGDRYSSRIDMTQAGEHRLSQRTIDLLGRLEGTYRVIVAANYSTLDGRAVQRAHDVLAAMAARAPSLDVTTIDTGSADGVRAFDELMADLVQAYEPEIQQLTGSIQQAALQAEQTAASLDQLSASLRELRELYPSAEPSLDRVRGYLEAQGGVSRVKAEDLRKSASTARELLKDEDAASARPGAITGLPPTDRATRVLRDQLAASATIAASAERELTTLARDQRSPAAARDRAGIIASSLVEVRDQAARTTAMLESLRHPPVLNVARTIQNTSAALVIGPPRTGEEPGMVAVSFEALFPSMLMGEESRSDVRLRAEDLFATALGTLANEASPVVIFVHGAPTEMGGAMAPVGVLADRLRLRGMVVAEWAPMLNPDPPSLARLDPSGKRPVVYVSIGTNADTPEGATRMAKLAAALRGLAESGKSVLLSAAPSALPSGGAKDPMVEFLVPWGVTVDTGRVVVTEIPTATSRFVTGEHFVLDTVGDHPVARAASGLPMHLLWPVAIKAAASEGGRAPVSMETLIELGGAKTWVESEWMDLRAARVSELDQPTRESRFDETQGPWSVGAAIERPARAGTKPQRMIIVASNGWFFDAITQKVLDVVDGRTVYQAPGNLELFEAAVYWLAGQDELIAASPAARAVPLIPNLKPGSLRLIQWALVAGLPALVLLVGAAWRLMRG